MRERCPDCGLRYLENPGDPWAFLLVLDRGAFILPPIALIYFGWLPESRALTVALFVAIGAVLIATTPHRYGVCVALDWLVRTRQDRAQSAETDRAGDDPVSEPRFEPIGEQHVEQIQALVEHDRAILENTRMPDPYPPDGARQYVLGKRSGSERAWAILDERGRLAGMCGLILHEDAAEIGYWIGAPFRGRGFASAGATEMVRVATEDLGYRMVRAQTRAVNGASRRVLERAGLELVGIRPNGEDVEKWPTDEPMADYRLELD